MAYQPEEMNNPNAGSEGPAPTTRPQFTRHSSTRYTSPMDAAFPEDYSDSGAGQKLRPQISRRNSSRMPPKDEPFRRERVVTFRDSFDSDNDEGSEEEDNRETRRALSAREAVAAQEAAEAAAAAAEEAAAAPVGMSLMDLLEETDRQMGLEGSRYIVNDDEDEYEEEVEGDGNGEVGGDAEYYCCVCMVRHKSAAFAPCGHTFCRMCSRELGVSKGNCPICNKFVLEILEIF